MPVHPFSALRPPLALALALIVAMPLLATGFYGPVIAIMTEPRFKTHAYVGATLVPDYVRWVEYHGARVVPMRFDAPDDEVDEVLSRISGVIFPGGGVPIGSQDPYGRFSMRVFQAAMKMKMPLWGTCLGFQQSLLYSSREEFPGPLSPGWKSTSMFAPLNLTSPQPSNATLLAKLPQRWEEEAAREPWTWHEHHWSVSIEDFAKRPVLRDFWEVLATNIDLRGREFVSLVQARSGLPFFGSQFHPEKNPYNFKVPRHMTVVEGPLPVNAPGAIELSNFFAAQFVDHARNFRRSGFSDDELSQLSMSRWTPRLVSSIQDLEWPSYYQRDEIYYFPPNGSKVERPQ